jgi:replicative DNA helicase
MAKSELKVINAVLKNKDIHVILGEPTEMFSSYGDMLSFMKEYYGQYKSAPSFDLVQDRFPDLEEVHVDGNTEHYVNDLKSQFLKSSLEQDLLKTAKLLETNSPQEVLSRLTGRVAALSKFTESVNIVDLKDYKAAADYYQEVARSIAESGTGALGIPSGIPAIDASMPNGFEPGHLCYVAGYSGRGKSWFTGKLAGGMWMNYAQSPMFVSLEMSPEAMRNRIYNMLGEGRFDMRSLAQGDINYDDFLEWGRNQIEHLPSFKIMSNENGQAITPNIIRGTAENLRPKVIVVDYAQICSDNAGTINMTEKMNNLAYEFKRLATSLGAVLFVVTAVKDDEGGKRTAPPTPSQIMYSRSLEYSADSIITVHRHQDTDLVEIGAIKNRNGDLFNFHYEVDFGRGIWTNTDMGIS